MKSAGWLLLTLLGAAALGLRIDILLKPVLWAAFLGLCVAYMFGANRVVERLLGVAAGLAVLITVWSAFVSSVHRAMPPVAGLEKLAAILGIGMVGLLAVLPPALMLLGIARVRSMLPKRQPQRPRTRARTGLQQPRQLPRQVQRRQDELGLLGEDNGQ